MTIFENSYGENGLKLQIDGTVLTGLDNEYLHIRFDKLKEIVSGSGVEIKHEEKESLYVVMEPELVAAKLNNFSSYFST